MVLGRTPEQDALPSPAAGRAPYSCMDGSGMLVTRGFSSSVQNLLPLELLVLDPILEGNGRIPPWL